MSKNVVSSWQVRTLLKPQNSTCFIPKRPTLFLSFASWIIFGLNRWNKFCYKTMQLQHAKMSQCFQYQKKFSTIAQWLLSIGNPGSLILPKTWFFRHFSTLINNKTNDHSVTRKASMAQLVEALIEILLTNCSGGSNLIWVF